MDEEETNNLQQTIQEYVQRQLTEIQTRQQQQEREEEHLRNREEQIEQHVAEMQERHILHPGALTEYQVSNAMATMLDNSSTPFVGNVSNNSNNLSYGPSTTIPYSWNTSPERPEEGQIRVGGIQHDIFYIVYHHELGIDIEKYDFRNVYRLTGAPLNKAVEDSIRQHINKRNSLAFETCALPNKGRRIFLMASAIVRYEILGEEDYKQRFEMRAAPSTTSVSKNTLE